MANDYKDSRDKKFGLEDGLPEDKFKQRLGIAGVVSVIANIALLSGAGALANNMGKTPPTPQSNIEVALIQATPEPTPIPLPTPEPTPTPQDQPTPVPTPENTVQPTPRPQPERARPTPRPERVVPTPEAALPTPEPIPTPDQPRPTPDQPKPTPAPTPEPKLTERPTATPSPAKPIDTPKVEREQPVSQPNQVASASTNNVRANNQSIQRETPALATTPVDTSVPRNLQTSTARRGSLPTVLAATAGPLSSRPSTNAAGASGEFTVPSTQVARLPGPAAARNGVADVKLGSSAAGTIATVTAAPSIETTSTERTRQIATVGGRRVRGSDATAILTARPDAPSASANFAVPSGGLRAGTATAVQGRALNTGAVASVGGGPGTQAYAGPEFSVSAPGSRALGAPGVARRTGRLSPNVGAPLSERSGRVSPTGEYGVVGPNTGGTRVASAAVRGNAAGSFNPNGVAGGGPGVRSGAGPSFNGGSEGGTAGGRNRGLSGNPGGGQRGGLRGGAIGGTGDGRPTGGRGGGVAGVPNGEIGGTGNGRDYRAGGTKGGAGGKGVGEGGGPGFASNGSGPSVEGGSKREAPKVVAHYDVPGEASGQTKNTRDAEATSQPEIEFPESVRGQQFSSSVTARVTIYANGTSSATLTKDSGNSEVDRAVLSALKRWKWKPAVQDGTPVNSTKSVNIRLSNK